MGARFQRSARNPHDRLPGRAEPGRQRRRRLQRPHGAGCADPGPHAAQRHRVLPRLGVAAGVDPAPARPCRPVRLRLPGPAVLRHRGARRPVGPGCRLHRPARLDRGLHPRRRLDRAGPDLGTVRRGRPHPAGRHPAPVVGRADHRGHRDRRVHAGLLQHRHPGPRGPARHPALHRRGLGGDQRPGSPGRPAACRRRRPADHRRRADVRVGGQPGRRGVDHGRRRPAQTGAGLRTGRPAEGGVGAAGAGAAQPGQVVPGRAVAPLADRAVLAPRRPTAVDRRRTAGRPVER